MQIVTPENLAPSGWVGKSKNIWTFFTVAKMMMMMVVVMVLVIIAKINDWFIFNEYRSFSWWIVLIIDIENILHISLTASTWA